MVQYERIYFIFLWHESPSGTWAASLLRFRDHTDTSHSLGRLWTRDQLVA